MTSYYWHEVAKTLVAEHAGEIAAAIVREQADHGSSTWFAEYSEAAGVLNQCVERDPSGVWHALRPYITPPASAYRFIVGFPEGLLDRMPPDEVGAWVAEKPEERAAIMARLASKDMSTDQTLVSRLLAEYGDNDPIAASFFSAYVSGSWWGPASSHWDQLAEALDTVAGRTALPKLRRWASDHARSLREMAERDREREQEQEIRGR
jgi:hypothetical protein